MLSCKVPENFLTTGKVNILWYFERAPADGPYSECPWARHLVHRHCALAAHCSVLDRFNVENPFYYICVWYICVQCLTLYVVTTWIGLQTKSKNHKNCPVLQCYILSETLRAPLPIKQSPLIHQLTHGPALLTATEELWQINSYMPS